MSALTGASLLMQTPWKNKCRIVRDFWNISVRFFYNVTSTVKSRTHTVWEVPYFELLDSTKIIENFCYKNRKHQYYKAPAKKSDNSTRLKLSKKGEAR